MQDNMHRDKIFYAKWLFRAGIATVFLYFGFLAIQNPELQARLWTKREILEVIAQLLPREYSGQAIRIVFTVFGLAELFVAFSLITGVWIRLGLGLAGLLLIGIIMNLGFNDISVRDFAILTGVVYLFSQELPGKNAKPTAAIPKQSVSSNDT